MMARGLRVLLVAALLSGIAPEAHAAEFQVVVHTSNQTSAISAKALSRLFLKKDKKWSDARPVTPVDLVPDSPVREAFTTAIHGRKVSSIKSYWQRQIFQGKAFPPMEQATEAEVLEFVAETPGAVGYVAPSTPLVPNVKTLLVED
jgi:ABC-type phosphate transport system substrate-binding protein